MPHLCCRLRAKWADASRAVGAIALCGLLAALPGGCVGRPAADPSAEATQAAATRALGVAEHLPKDTGWLAVAPNLGRALDLLGRAALTDKHSELLERLAAKSVAELDHDLLSSRGQSEIGLDPRGPAGVASLEPARAAVVLFATLADPRRFKTAAYRHFHRRALGLAPHVTDGVLVLASSDDKSFALVVRDSLAMVVVPRGASDAGELAQELAALEPGDSLAVTRGFQAVAGAPWAATDLLVYANPQPVLRQHLGLEPRWEGSTFAQAATALELEWRSALGKARSRGASAERLVAIDDEFRAARRALRDDPAAERRRAWIGSLGALTLGMDLLPNGVRARGSLRLEPGSPVARLLRNRTELPVLVRKLPERPVLLLEVAVDPAMLAELAALAGAPIDELGKELGLDLGKELGNVLSGELDLAVLHDFRLSDDPKAQAEGEAVRWTAPRRAVVLGVRDAVRARTLLSRLAKATGTAGWLEAGAREGELLVKLHGQVESRLTLGPRDLVLSSDDRLGALLAEGAAPVSRSSWQGTGHRMMRRLATTEHAALDLGLDLGLVGLFGQSHEGLNPVQRAAKAPGESPTAAVATNAGPSPRSGASPVSDATPSAEAQAKAEELGAVEQLIARLRQQLARDRMNRPVDLGRRVGTVALRCQRTQTGLQVEAGWVVGADSLAAMTESLLGELWPAEPQRKSEAEIEAYLAELTARRARLETELEAARARAPVPP